MHALFVLGPKGPGGKVGKKNQNEDKKKNRHQVIPATVRHFEGEAAPDGQ
jgi:hypothetical protein